MRDNEKARGSVKKEFDEFRRRRVWGEKDDQVREFSEVIDEYNSKNLEVHFG